MNYRVVYDVLDDPLLAGHGAGPTMLVFAIVWTTLWVVLHRWNRAMPPDRQKNWRAGPIVGGILGGVGLLILMTEAYPTAADQRQCRDWVRRGEYGTVAGPIAHFRKDVGKNPERQFEVGELSFAYRMSQPKAGGFWGVFTAPGSESLQLRDGLQVRVAHRDGRILRLEIAE